MAVTPAAEAQSTTSKHTNEVTRRRPGTTCLIGPRIVVEQYRNEELPALVLRDLVRFE